MIINGGTTMLYKNNYKVKLKELDKRIDDLSDAL